MIVGMISNIVPPFSYRLQILSILFQRGILTNDKKGDLEIQPVQLIKKTGNENIEVGRILLPTVITVGSHVGPFIVQIQRNSCQRFIFF